MLVLGAFKSAGAGRTLVTKMIFLADLSLVLIIVQGYSRDY